MAKPVVDGENCRECVRLWVVSYSYYVLYLSLAIRNYNSGGKALGGV